MAKVEVKALDTFMLGRRDVKQGDIFRIGQGEADELKASGLVSIEGEPTEDEADEVDDLIGAKMEPITSNKMEPKPDNKSAKK